MHTYETLSEAVNDLVKRGYTVDLTLKPDCVHCAAIDLNLHPEDFKIDEHYRFEGMSNPDDNSIVYAISSNDDKIKGILVDAYGMYAETLSTEMVKRLRFEED